MREVREVSGDDEAESAMKRRRDICGDNGLMILIFTYLLSRQVARWRPTLVM